MPMPPAPRIIPLLLLSNGTDALLTTEQMVAAPRALKPLPSQGISVSEASFLADGALRDMLLYKRERNTVSRKVLVEQLVGTTRAMVAHTFTVNSS
jgi:hypothetical protein